MSGKVYSGEKAVISLTSWKKRIDTVGLTLFSLLKQCPGFHIVLVLSEEEFPKKEAELPASLMAFVNANMIEILWVFENTKSFKKVLPTLSVYRHLPVITADDDCIYKTNYADKLLNTYYRNGCKYAVSNSKSFGSGFGVLLTWDMVHNYSAYLNENVVETGHDDLFYRFVLLKNNIPCKYLSERNELVNKTVQFTSNDGISCSIDEGRNILLFNKIFGLCLTQKDIANYAIR